jgi:hypothetical protein
VQSLGVSPSAYTLYRLRVRQAISSNASPLQPASMGEGETADAIVFIIHFIRSQRAKEHLCRIGPRESAIIWPDAFEVPLVAYALYK